MMSENPTITLKPSEIRFTQDSIAKAFKDGRECNDVYRDIRNGYTSVNDIPVIKVAQKDGKYYSPNNRRLYVFRALEYDGIISKIQVKIIRYQNIKFQHGITSRNDGRSVKMRGDTELPHSIEQIKSKQETRRRSAALQNRQNIRLQSRREVTVNNSYTRRNEPPERAFASPAIRYVSPSNTSTSPAYRQSRETQRANSYESTPAPWQHDRYSPPMISTGYRFSQSAQSSSNSSRASSTRESEEGTSWLKVAGTVVAVGAVLLNALFSRK